MYWGHESLYGITFLRKALFKPLFDHVQMTIEQSDDVLWRSYKGILKTWGLQSYVVIH